MSAAAVLVDRLHNRLAALRAKLARRLRIALAHIARTIRAGLVRAGIPLQREYLILRCAEGEDASGLFSELAAALGFLEHYLKWRPLYSGLQIDFADKGLYFEPSAGPNWWQYYFEPIGIGSQADANPRSIDLFQHDVFAERVEQTMPRATGAAIVARYFHLRPVIRRAVDEYISSRFGTAFVIGIHYRGTDKIDEAPRVPYETVLAAVENALGAAAHQRCKLFLATDEQAFLECMHARYPDQLLFREMYRSVDGIPIHRRQTDNLRMGEDAVIDCLLLSRCHRLIRTASDLGLFATLFNPALPEILLSRPRWRGTETERQ